MGEKGKNQTMRPLRIISPKLYTLIIGEFETYNIHSYDLMIEGEKKDKGIQIRILFGEHFAHTETEFFSFESIEKMSDELIQFIKSAAETCKETMIADYFKMMAP